MSIRLLGVLILFLFLPIVSVKIVHASEGNMCSGDSLMCVVVAENEVCLAEECVLEVQAGNVQGDVVHVAENEVLEVDALGGLIESEEVVVPDVSNDDVTLEWGGDVEVLEKVDDVVDVVTEILGEEMVPEVMAAEPTSVPVMVTQVEELVYEVPRLSSEVLMSMINQHRVEIGKPAFVEDGHLCEIAKVRAMEAEDEMWGGKGMHVGLVARSEGYRIRENLISMQTEEKAFGWWMNSPVHRAGIEGDFVYSCGACSGRNCVALFTNWERR